MGEPGGDRPVSSTVRDSVELPCGCQVLPEHEIGARAVSCAHGRWSLTVRREVIIHYDVASCPTPIE
jgi:hypothetical protein